jgi:hypothetical protein
VEYEICELREGNETAVNFTGNTSVETMCSLLTNDETQKQT